MSRVATSLVMAAMIDCESLWDLFSHSQFIRQTMREILPASCTKSAVTAANGGRPGPAFIWPTALVNVTPKPFLPRLFDHLWKIISITGGAVMTLTKAARVVLIAASFYRASPGGPHQIGQTLTLNRVVVFDVVNVSVPLRRSARR